jgi:hypothetical protein
MMKTARFMFFAFLFFCRLNLYSQAEDNWQDLISYDGIEGLWEGNAVSYVVIDGKYTHFTSRLNFTMTFNYKSGSTIVNSFVECDFSDFLADNENYLGGDTGYTQDELWQYIRNLLSIYEFEFENYSFFFNNTAPAEEYFAADTSGKFLINDAGDSLLLIYYRPVFVLGLGDRGFTRMLFKKVS